MASLEQLLIGLKNPIAVDVSTADYTVSNLVRGITVNGAGNVEMEFSNGNTVTIYLEAGIQYYFAGIKKILSANTTATGIVIWE